MYNLIRRSPSASLTASKMFNKRNPKLSLASVCMLFYAATGGFGLSSCHHRHNKTMYFHFMIFSCFLITLLCSQAQRHRSLSLSAGGALAVLVMFADNLVKSVDMTNLSMTSATVSWSQVLFSSGEPCRMCCGIKPSGVSVT